MSCFEQEDVGGGDDNTLPSLEIAGAGNIFGSERNPNVSSDELIAYSLPINNYTELAITIIKPLIEDKFDSKNFKAYIINTDPSLITMKVNNVEKDKIELNFLTQQITFYSKSNPGSVMLDVYVEDESPERKDVLWGSINMCIYDWKTTEDIEIVRVRDPNSPNSEPEKMPNSEEIKNYINDIYKPAIANYTFKNVVNVDINFDVNKNGAIDYYIRMDDSPVYNPEVSALLTDPSVLGPNKVIYSHFYCTHWIITRTARKDDNKVDLETTRSLVVGNVYRIGTGNNYELIKITSKSNLGADFIRQVVNSMGQYEDAYPIYLQNDHGVNETVYELSVGFSLDDKIIVTDNCHNLNRTIAHEFGHLSFNLTDIDYPTQYTVRPFANLMYFAETFVHEGVRYAAGNQLFYYGILDIFKLNSYQWSTIH